MNRILLEKQAVTHTFEAGDPRFTHVRGVLRMQAGDTFDVGVINGPVGKATVTAVDSRKLAVRVEWGGLPPKPPAIHLLVGMCRPATARKILTTAPTLGVRELIFTPTTRSDPAYARSSLWTASEWRQRLIEGVEQAFDTWLPELRLPESLEVAVRLVPQTARKLALDVYEGSLSLRELPFDAAETVCLAIGPERGWAEPDRRLLREHGFELVSVGDRVMRVETAVTVAQALVLDRLGRL